MGHRIDMVGQKFGRWTVLWQVANNKHNQRMFHCKCDCGTERVCNGGDLRSGNSKSCGCLLADITIVRSIKHGMRHTKVYRAWQSMKDRCTNTGNIGWDNYGGRGITFCDDWQSFENFYSDMGDLPFEGAELDRIDTNGNYGPSNCRWVSHKQNVRNTRSNVRIEFNGVIKCLSEWSEYLGISNSALRYRLRVANWPLEMAFTEPVRGNI